MFGKDGNQTKLSKSVLKNFYRRAECFTDQFDEYYGETKPPEMPGTTEDPSESWGMMVRKETTIDKICKYRIYSRFH